MSIKSKGFENDIENKLPILEEIPEKSINTNDEKPTHILIEGDNYHALTCLNYTHKNKINVIYIDPPYNTGSDDFRYKDKRILNKYPDGSEVPKELMKDSGVIFISIDINELAQLKLLCDDIFGESNFVSLISIKVKDTAGLGQSNFIFDVAEAAHQELPVNYEILTEQYGSYNKMVIDFGQSKFIKEISREKFGSIKIYQCENYKVENTNKFTFKEYKKNRDKIFADYNPIFVVSWDTIKDEIPSVGLSYIEYVPARGRNTGNIPNASLHVEGGVYFTNGKKPLTLLQKLLGMFKIKNAIVLDFFAGSGTTGEAVMIQNEEDKLNRQFILVTNNDEVTNGKVQQIMTDVCYPRIKNVIKGYGNRNPLGNSVKYYKTSFVGENNILNANDKDKAQLAHNAGELLAIAENTLEQIEKNDY
ncbi:12432_t:CDS:2 [Racocetra persica]|uniref:12432_t:CDS:1 n=1 Tax=Racocetra persica TaxID=160502 RepID=A0ACA9PAL6_9GLOM|nr:12432_t:CDS:2 [Racocetra persica]